MSATNRLETIQRDMASVVMTPLTDWETSAVTILGEKSHDVAERIIESNDRLSSLERLSIYNKQYWYRLIDCMYEDFKGTFSIFGKKDFNKIIFAYLEKYPSKSFTLRYLGLNFVSFLIENRELFSEKADIAIDIARLEWANIVAFEGRALARLTPEILSKTDPQTLVLNIQPHIGILEFSYPVDDFYSQIKKTPINDIKAPLDIPEKKKVYIVVHRQENSVYHKPIEKAAFYLLIALKEGLSLEASCEKALPYFDNQEQVLQKIQAWFQTWSALGWFALGNKD